MDPAPRPPTSSLRLDLVMTIMLVLGALVYAVFLFRNGSPYAGGADSSGYMNTARLLDQGRFFGDVRTPTGHGHMSFSHGAFQPLGFTVDTKLPRMAPTYPLGLPLQLLVAAKIAGWDHAAPAVNIFTALAGGGMLWALARRLDFSRTWAAIAVLWLWLCPQYIYCSLQPMSDSPATLWSLVVLYTALRSREGGGWCLGCGAAVAMAILVRPTNALLFAPVFFAIGFRPISLLWLGLGGLPGAFLWGYYNYHVYGAVITTGYGDVASAFSREFLAHNLGHLSRWIPALLSPLICAGLALPFLRGRWSRDALILTFWTLLITGFYAFYFHTGETWWYLRFVLPAFPLLILGAIAVWQKIPLKSTFGKIALVATFVTALSLWEIKFNRRLYPVAIAAEEKSYQLSATWARANLPADSAIFCMQVSGAFYFYTDFLLVRWDQIQPGFIDPLLGVLQTQHRPVYAILYEFETTEALNRIGGHWERIATIGLASAWQRKD